MPSKKRKRVSDNAQGPIDSPAAGHDSVVVDTAAVAAQPAKKRATAPRVNRGAAASQLAAKTRALTTLAEMPKDMVKYWYFRHRLFSRYDEGILLDKESWFSVTPEAIAARMAERCRANVVLDLFCGAGGNAIQFAQTCDVVIAVDVDPLKIQLAKHNAAIYGVEDRIHFLVGDAREFISDHIAAIESKRRPAEGTAVGGGAAANGADSKGPAALSKWGGHEHRDIDVVFLSPPWGGVTYTDPSSLTSTPVAAAAGQESVGGPQEAVGGAGSSSSSKTTKSETKAKTKTHGQAADSSFCADTSLPLAFATPSRSRSGRDTAIHANGHSHGQEEEGEGEYGYEYEFYPLSALRPISGQHLFSLVKQIAPNVAMFLPKNCDLAEIAALVGPDKDDDDDDDNDVNDDNADAKAQKHRPIVAVEEQYLGQNLKGLAVYFGDLATQWDEDAGGWVEE